MKKIRILLADDHAIVRAGLRLLLESQPDLEVVGEAADGRETVQRVRELHPDVVVMDIAMPDLNGLEATRRIKQDDPQVQILALTMHENERYFFQMIHAGASGYVVKGAPPSDFLQAVRSVHQGQAYLYPSLAKKLLEEYLSSRARDDREVSDDLTDREREVLRLIAEGKTGKEIAELLTLSVHTVERHRQNIMGKLQLHNRAELTRYAIRKGLIDLEA
ncbi:MAG: response regulator transcription factor [Chloroflexi bacterium]|nr:response regulator transcription factor [Chloroflexota bacterium]